MTIRRWLYCWGLGFLILAAGIAGGLGYWGWSYKSDALWHLVQQCSRSSDHKPCSLYAPKEGYVLLKDRTGQGQYLLLPTQRIYGIEGESLTQPQSPSYLQEAWDHRQLVPQAYGRPLPDEVLSLAINSRWARSQNQLHIHIDCLRSDVMAQLAHLPAAAQAGQIMLRGHTYRWRRVASLTPSPLLGDGAFFSPQADGEERSRYGVAVAFQNGQFLILQTRAHGTEWGGAEEVQDHKCAL